MEPSTNSTAQRLMRAFMRLNKVAWHPQPIAGHTLSEIRVLFCIKHGARADSPGMKVSDISRLLDVTSPTVTQLLKGLERDGLVKRRIDRRDRRAVVITLTEKGEMIIREAVEAFLASFQGLIGYLGEEQSNQLAELLSKVFIYYDEAATSTSRSPWHGDTGA